jgi:hypothetical protein
VGKGKREGKRRRKRKWREKTVNGEELQNKG